MSYLKIAIQKNGRLSEKSISMLTRCGIKISNYERTLKSFAENFPIEILFLRDDDIPQYVEKGVADIGILGENEVIEQSKNVAIIKKLGFAKCRMSLAINKEIEFNGLAFFQHKKIATSYPNILGKFLKNHDLNSEIEVIGGSVEISPSIGLSDGILDIVSTGSTLLTNGLKEVYTVLNSEAVIIKNQNLPPSKLEILNKLIFRIDALLNAEENKYILLNAPNESIDKITKIIPGMKSPTLLPLQREGWSSIHSVVKENDFWEVIDSLKTLGAEGILVVPIEKMIL